MMKSRFSESRIIAASKQNESGRKVDEICCELGISNGTFYQWRREYAGIGASQLKEMKVLQVENAQLKRMVPEHSLRTLFTFN